MDAITQNLEMWFISMQHTANFLLHLAISNKKAEKVQCSSQESTKYTCGLIPLLLPLNLLAEKY